MKRKNVIATIAVIVLVGATAAATYFITASSVRKTMATDAAKKKATNKPSTGRSSDTTEADSSDTNSTIRLVLYFPDAQAQYLVPEIRQIAKTENIALAAVQELLKGPKKAGNHAAVPNTMVVQSVTVSDGLAAVDFGAVFGSLIPSGEAGESMFIYSIVDTLTGLEGITRVKFMAGGQIPAVPNSRIDFSAAFTRNDSIVKK